MLLQLEEKKELKEKGCQHLLISIHEVRFWCYVDSYIDFSFFFFYSPQAKREYSMVMQISAAKATQKLKNNRQTIVVFIDRNWSVVAFFICERGPSHAMYATNRYCGCMQRLIQWLQKIFRPPPMFLEIFAYKNLNLILLIY